MAERKKPAESPGYVKAKDVAELLDLTIQRVGQLRKEGIFTQYKTPAGDRYKLVDTVKAYIRYLRSQNSGKTNPVEDRKAEAEANLKEAKAAIAMMQREELEGQMHRSEDVVAVQSADGTVEIIRAEANRRDSEPPTPAAALAVRHPAALTAA